MGSVMSLRNDSQSESEIFLLYVDEAERRLADLHTRKAREYPADEVLKSVRAALR